MAKHKPKPNTTNQLVIIQMYHKVLLGNYANLLKAELNSSHVPFNMIVWIHVIIVKSMSRVS